MGIQFRVNTTYSSSISLQPNLIKQIIESKCDVISVYNKITKKHIIDLDVAEVLANAVTIPLKSGNKVVWSKYRVYRWGSK